MPRQQGQAPLRSRRSLSSGNNSSRRSSASLSGEARINTRVSFRSKRESQEKEAGSISSRSSKRDFVAASLGPRLPRDTSVLQFLFGVFALVGTFFAQISKMLISFIQGMFVSVKSTFNKEKTVPVGSRVRPARNVNTRPQASRSAPLSSNTALSRSKRVADLESSRSIIGAIQTFIAGLFERARLLVLIIGGLILIFVVGFVILYNSSLFEVKEITVSGNEHIAPSELTELASVGQGSTLIRLDTAALEAKIKQNPWVLSVDVQRMFPHTINLALKERTVAAYVDIPAQNSGVKTVWALSQDGVWIAQIPAGSEALKDTSILHITDVAYGVEPVAGDKCKDESILGALKILDSLTTSLKDQVASLRAPSLDNISIILTNGVEIVLGSEESIRDKERICLKLMEEHPGKISYINVRVPDRPTWRSA